MEPISCPTCNSTDIIKFGTTEQDKQRYKCQNTECTTKTFIRDYTYLGRLPEIKEKIIDMAVNGNGIRDTARVLEISPSTVINELKKKRLSSKQ
jgi:transposase-like protein